MDASRAFQTNMFPSHESMHISRSLLDTFAHKIDSKSCSRALRYPPHCFPRREHAPTLIQTGLLFLSFFIPRLASERVPTGIIAQNTRASFLVSRETHTHTRGLFSLSGCSTTFIVAALPLAGSCFLWLRVKNLFRGFAPRSRFTLNPFA